MKYLFVLFTFTLICLNLNAQNYNDVKQVEFEFGLGVISSNKYDGASAKMGVNLFMEARLNVADTPFDVGLQATSGYFEREDNKYELKQEISSNGLISFVDYNFRKWKNIAAFTGLGVGLAAVDNTYISEGTNSNDISDRSFVLNPRMGVEVYNHLRITAEYKLMNSGYSFAGINVGIVLGGGYHK
jgi:hypothetical protein